MRDRQGRTLIERNGELRRSPERDWRTIKVRDELVPSFYHVHNLPTREAALDMHVLDRVGSCRCQPEDRNAAQHAAPHVWEHNPLVTLNG